MDRPHISFAGAGRVATALCTELHRRGYIIDMVVSKTEKSAKNLALSVSCQWSQALNFPDDNDIIIVAVPDHSLKSVLNDLECGNNTVVVHTAGSFGLEVFPEKINRKGILYPLQTFSQNREINFTEVPFLLESGDDFTGEILQRVASSLSNKVIFSNAEKRSMLHLAAIFSCNFTNYMFTAGNEIARKAGFQANILDPLIKETVSKALEQGPERSQTGPAVRNDTNTIENHLRILSSMPGLRDLYKSVTDSIMDYYKIMNSDKL